MKYRTVKTANGDLNISSIVMGSAMSMSRLPKDIYFDIFDTYFEAGGNIVDTARSYGTGGRLEKQVGDYLKETGRTDKVIISTKGCHPYQDMLPRLSYEDMEKDVTESLEVLYRDHIDLWWIHKDDESVPVEGIVDGFNRLIKEGKVSAVGCSNWTIDRIKAAQDYAEATGQTGFAASQINWSLAFTVSEFFRDPSNKTMDDRSYDWYYAHNMPIFSFSSQAQGFFPRIDAAGIAGLPEDLQKSYVSPENLRRLKFAKEFAEKHDCSLSAVALAYLINNKLTCFPIIGAENVDMLKQSLEAADVEMTAEESDWLYHSAAKRQTEF